MNHIYRIVWNALTSTWVAVAENARSHGKGSKRAARKAGRQALAWATLATIGLAATAAMAQSVPTTVVPTGGKTVAYTAGNGVPIIDINTANAAGLSHNKFTSYNVDARGLVLNNGNMEQLSRLSQLAGQVAANANLAQQARVILNEVVSTNRSVLAGFTEVLGGRADVVVANPNGITCSGCGFINSDRVTLTTGTPTFGADGSLGGFNVNRGDVLVNGTGANATAQQIFDIVARSVKVDGKINTSDTGSLGITAGANNWSYGGRNVTGAASPSGAAGGYAIDSTALGGMYSGRINIIATEAGVGVRMLGEAAASADNFTLTSTGKIELQAALSAKQDLAVTTTAATGNEDLFVNSAAKLSAAANLTLNAAGGQVKLAEGELYAANNLTTTAASLSDASASAKTRFAGGSNTLAITGAANINGTAWGAGGALAGNADSLTIGANGATLYAGTTLALSTTNNLALGTVAVRSTGNMTLTADTGSISTAAGTAQGIQSTAGNLSLSAGGGLSNAGKITADAGSVTARINGTLANSGTLQAKTTFDLADKAGGGTENIVNSGILLADGGLTVKATSISNQAGATLQGAGTTLAANSLTNAGTLIASNTAAQTSALTLAALTNSGMLQSKGNLALNLATSLNNTGTILTNGALTLRGTSGTYTVAGTGRMQADGLLDIKGQGAGKGVDITVNSGGVLLGGSADINANTLTVQDNGMVTTTGNMTVDVNSLNFGGAASRIVAATSGTGSANVTTGSAFNNVGAAHSGGDMTFNAPSISNSGTGAFSALKTLSVSATTGNLDNYGALYAGQTLNANAMGTLTNRAGATIDSGGDINIDTPAIYVNANTPTFTNNSTVNATGNINIAATWFNNNIIASNTRAWNGYSYGTQLVGNAAGKDSTSVEAGPVGSFAPTAQWFDGAIAANYCNFQVIKVITCGLSEYGRLQPWSRSQYFTSGDPTGAVKPQIIAGGNTTISNFQTANNLGGVISGNSVTLTSSRGGATFTNDDLRLATESGTLGSIELNYWAGLAYTAAKYWTRFTYAADTTTLDGKQGMKRTGVSYNASTGIGAGVFANGGNLTVSGTVNLINMGGTSVDAAQTSTPTSRAANGVAAVNGQTALAFAGLVINLPTNPNGFFVLSTNPSARYLIETNPRFVTGQGSLGSDFLLKRLGIDPEGAQKRLGDANYEAFLVRQQLIAQTGNNILKGYGNEADQMKRLMDQAADQSKEAGLVFGKALTPEQVANLKSDIVWMVETTVAGQRVLAPVVYLATATRTALVTGAVFAGTNVSMNVASLTNTGGLISGSNALNIVAKNDITNISGTITGGNVALQSTDGSINNITTVLGNAVGNTASITATRDLSLDAKKDITVSGGALKAGGDVSLRAGNNVTLDTIVKTATNITAIETDDGLQRSRGTSVTTTSTNVGSLLASGGRININSGRDTTVAGSTVNAGRGLGVNAGGNFNVLARQDTSTTNSEVITSGVGVGGGVLGTEKVTVDSFRGTNAGSSINVGSTNQPANLTVNTAGSMTVQGARVNVTGNANIDARQGINIVDGQDVSRTTTKTETTAFLKTSGDGSASAATNADANANARTGVSTAANAQAGANAQASGNGSITLSESSNTVTQTDTGRSVATSFRVGGNLTATTDGTLLVQGSRLDVAGNGNINANAGIRFVDGANTERTTTTNLTASLLRIEATGLANASANTSAGAGGDAARGNIDRRVAGTLTGTGVPGATEKPSINAQANAGAEAGGDAVGSLNIKVSETSVTKSQSGSNTSVASGINFGGNLNATTGGTLTLIGSNLSAGGDLNLQARNTEVLAGRNETFSTSKTERASVGLFNDNNAGASAGGGAQGNLGTGNKETDAKAGANAGARAGVTGSANVEATLGVRGEIESTTASTLTNTGSTISAGRNLSISATETAQFVGAQVSSGGDLAVAAKNIVNLAAQDTTSNTSSKVMLTAGVFAEGNANANASASVGRSNGASAGAGLDGSAGVSIKGTQAEKADGSTTLQVSSFQAGGNITRTAQGGITDQGTQLAAGGNINQTARTLTEIDARNSQFSTSMTASTTNKFAGGGTVAGEASATGGAGGAVGAGFRGSMSGSFDTASQTSTNTVTGRYTAGGDINSATTEKTTLIGTQFASGGNIQINAGSLDFKAAQDTSSSTSNSSSGRIAAKVDVVGKVGGGVEGNLSTEGKNEKTTTAVAGGLNAGGNLSINTTGDVRLEGTKIESVGKTAIAAGGTVDLTAARDTRESNEYKVAVGAGVDTSKAGMGVRVSGEVAVGVSNASTAQAGSIRAGDGGISITAGKDVKLEGTALQTTGNTALEAGGKVEMKAAESTLISTSAGVSAGVGASRGKNESNQTEASGSVSGSARLAVENKVESQAVSINSGGGNVTIKGANVVNQQADIQTTGAKEISGNVTEMAANNSSVSVKLSGGITKEKKITKQDKQAGKPAAKPGLSPTSGTVVKPAAKLTSPAAATGMLPAKPTVSNSAVQP